MKIVDLLRAVSGADPVFGSPAEIAALIRREVDSNGALIRRLDVSPEQ